MLATDDVCSTSVITVDQNQLCIFMISCAQKARLVMNADTQHMGVFRTGLLLPATTVAAAIFT